MFEMQPPGYLYRTSTRLFCRRIKTGRVVTLQSDKRFHRVFQQERGCTAKAFVSKSKLVFIVHFCRLKESPRKRHDLASSVFLGGIWNAAVCKTIGAPRGRQYAKDAVNAGRVFNERKRPSKDSISTDK